MSLEKKNIAILLGDPSGIGPELISKLLSKEITNKALEGGKDGVMQINHERKKNSYK